MNQVSKQQWIMKTKTIHNLEKVYFFILKKKMVENSKI